ncbi:hypothetical protein EJB05_32945, partial [Eragrostis curvula]
MDIEIHQEMTMDVENDQEPVTDDVKNHQAPSIDAAQPAIDELGSFLAGVTIPHAGVLPNIHPVLLPKKTVKKASSKEVNSPKKAAVQSPEKA